MPSRGCIAPSRAIRCGLSTKTARTASTGGIIQTLHSRPLRDLTWSELSRFGWQAMTTWGTVDDLRHFLPRMLELVAIELDPKLTPADGPTDAVYDWPYDHSALVGKLEYGKWQTWPRREREAIHIYLLALWRHLLVTYPSSFSVETTPACLARIGEDLMPYLDAWRADARLASLRHLAAFVISGVWDILGYSVGVSWCRRALALEPRTRKALEAAFFAHAAEAPLAEEFSDAVNRLTWQTPAT
jgi:hypothetical protein